MLRRSFLFLGRRYIAVNRLYRVLIFDNNTGSFDRIRKMSVWRDMGFEIVGKTTDINSLTEICAKNGVEMVVCFNRAPLISAETIISAVRAASDKIVCIAVSPYDDSENMRKCFILGALDYLTEPVGESRLEEALGRAAERIASSFVGSEYALTLQEYLGEIKYRDEKFAERLTEFLLGCENITVTTEYAADWFGFNKDYFGRMFKQKIGKTFGDFYKLFRIRYAEKLLMSGRYKVYEVSELLGFSSVDYFTSVFKKLTGKTPSQLKRM